MSTQNTIPVVDDDDFLREYLEERLSISGYKVITASNGLKGLRAYLQHGADLVLTDIVMPDSEGIEFIQKLRAESPTLPVIAMTGFAQADMYLSVASIFGANRILKKPFSPQELLKTISAALTEGSQPSS